MVANKAQEQVLCSDCRKPLMWGHQGKYSNSHKRYTFSCLTSAPECSLKAIYLAALDDADAIEKYLQFTAGSQLSQNVQALWQANKLKHASILLADELLEVVSQACYVETDEDGYSIYDSYAMSAYEGALLTLAELGMVEIVEAGRVIARRKLQQVKPEELEAQ